MYSEQVELQQQGETYSILHVRNGSVVRVLDDKIVEIEVARRKQLNHALRLSIPIRVEIRHDERVG